MNSGENQMLLFCACFPSSGSSQTKWVGQDGVSAASESITFQLDSHQQGKLEMGTGSLFCPTGPTQPVLRFTQL